MADRGRSRSRSRSAPRRWTAKAQAAEGSLKIYRLQAARRPSQRPRLDAAAVSRAPRRRRPRPRSPPPRICPIRIPGRWARWFSTRASPPTLRGSAEVLVPADRRRLPGGARNPGPVRQEVTASCRSRSSIRRPTSWPSRSRIARGAGVVARAGAEFTALWGTGYDQARAFVEIEHRRKIAAELLDRRRPDAGRRSSRPSPKRCAAASRCA